MRERMGNRRQPGKKKITASVFLDWVEELVMALCILAVVFTFCFRVITVSGTSMAPQYQDGDRILLVNPFSAPKQGDVVVIVNVLEEPIIKRVMATEGQTVDFDYEAKRVLVDGVPVDETAFGLENGVTEYPYTSFELLEFPQTVPEGCLFVLGDNRAVSEDSRYQVIGMIDQRDVLGKAVFHVFPLWRGGLV